MNTALVLGGGGALGDFELGVLQYLYSYNIRPQIICGTSVGATNAAKLAEGEGGDGQGFKGLRNIWLQNMNSPSDMYAKEPAFAALPDDMQSEVEAQLATAVGTDLVFGGLARPDLGGDARFRRDPRHLQDKKDREREFRRRRDQSRGATKEPK